MIKFKKYIQNNIFNLIGWIGSLFMVIFAFNLNINFAIIGLILLTIQAIKNKLNNLILLNIISLIGFASQLI